MKQNGSRLIPLNKTRLHEEIVEQLKDRIIRGDFPPDSKLPPERELADQLQVNRTTVREALHKLEGLGLIEIKHGNGIFVKDYRESGSLELAKHVLFMDGRPNLGVLQNLMDLRRLMVPEISYCAAKNRSEADLADLERIVFKSDAMPVEERDWRVHNIIARASGNLLFLILLNSFTDLARRFSALYFRSPDNCRRSEKFHREIFQAIKDKLPAKARKIMQDVLAYAEQQTFLAIESEENG